MRRFQRGLDEIKKVLDGYGILTDLWAREIVKLEAERGAGREGRENDARDSTQIGRRERGYRRS